MDVTGITGQVWRVAGEMWSAATCRRFSAGTTCRSGSTASSGASPRERRLCYRRRTLPHGEPLHAALPERQVAQARKAETSLRTPKLRGTRNPGLVDTIPLGLGIHRQNRNSFHKHLSLGFSGLRQPPSAQLCREESWRQWWCLCPGRTRHRNSRRSFPNVPSCRARRGVFDLCHSGCDPRRRTSRRP